MSTSLAALEMWMGNVDRARAILKDGTDAAYQTGDVIHRANTSLSSVVIAYETLGSDDAVAAIDAWLPTLRAQGFLWATGLALRTAGDVRRDAGDTAGAEPLYAESVALHRRGDVASLAQVLTRQADARRQRGALTAAHDALDEAFAITRRLGSRFLLPECLDVLARVRREAPKHSRRRGTRTTRLPRSRSKRSKSDQGVRALEFWDLDFIEISNSRALTP
jgi:hypothetical protein